MGIHLTYGKSLRKFNTSYSFQFQNIPRTLIPAKVVFYHTSQWKIVLSYVCLGHTLLFEFILSTQFSVHHIQVLCKISCSLSHHEISLENQSCLVVGIRVSDMHCLRIRVRQSRSLDLGSSLLLSKLDLLHLVFSLMLPPNLSTGYVALFSLVFLLSSKLVPYYLSYCGYMLLFRCINSRPSWPSEIEKVLEHLSYTPVSGIRLDN